MKKFLYGTFIGVGIAIASYMLAAGFNDVQIGPWVINSSNNAGVSTTTGIRETSNTWPVQIATSSAFSREGLFNLTTYGSTTIQTPIDTLNAFRVQNSASTTIFAIDTLNGSTTVRGPLFSSNSSNLGSSGSRWGTLFANTVDTNALTFVVATPSNANFGSNISVNGGTINLGASPNTATTTFVANGSGQLTLSAAGTNQNVIVTPSGTGFTLLNGNVGIGTTGPGKKLDVSGTGRITTANGDGTAFTVVSNDVDDVGLFIRQAGSDSASALSINNAADTITRHFFRGDGTAVLANGAGNVGIGTTSPGALFSVAGAGYLTGQLGVGRNTLSGVQVISRQDGTGIQVQYGMQNSQTAASGVGSSLSAYNNANSNIGQLGLIYEGSANDTSAMVFYTASSGTSAERVRITSTGNVGIGTTSPAKLLSSSGGDALISNTGTTTLNVDTPTANRGSCIELRAASSSDIYRLYVGTNPNNQDSLVVERGSCK